MHTIYIQTSKKDKYELLLWNRRYCFQQTSRLWVFYRSLQSHLRVVPPLTIWRALP